MPFNIFGFCSFRKLFVVFDGFCNSFVKRVSATMPVSDLGELANWLLNELVGLSPIGVTRLADLHK